MALDLPKYFQNYLLNRNSDGSSSQKDSVETKELTWPNHFFLKIFKEQIDPVSDPFSEIIENSWRVGIVPKDWKRAIFVIQKGRGKDPGSNRFLRLILIVGEALKQILNSWALKKYLTALTGSTTAL